MNTEAQLKMYEEENHRMHNLVDTYKGKCYRHGLLFNSNSGYNECPACFFEGELNALKAQIETLRKGVKDVE